MELGENFNSTAYIDALAARGINVLALWSYIAIVDQIGDSRIGYDAPERWPWQSVNGSFDLKQFNAVYFGYDVRYDTEVGHAELLCSNLYCRSRLRIRYVLSMWCILALSIQNKNSLIFELLSIKN